MNQSLLEQVAKAERLQSLINRLQQEIEDKDNKIREQVHIIAQRDERISSLELKVEDQAKVIKEMQASIDRLQNENAKLKTYLAASLAQLE